MEKKNRKEINKYDYDISNLDNIKSVNIFSIGIFRWIPKITEEGLKKDKVIFRLKTSLNDKEKLIYILENYCDLLDKGWIPPYKTLTIK